MKTEKELCNCTQLFYAKVQSKNVINENTSRFWTTLFNCCSELVSNNICVSDAPSSTLSLCFPSDTVLVSTERFELFDSRGKGLNRMVVCYRRSHLAFSFGNLLLRPTILFHSNLNLIPSKNSGSILVPIQYCTLYEEVDCGRLLYSSFRKIRKFHQLWQMQRKIFNSLSLRIKIPTW